jgi:hypothetical protein
LKSFCSASSPCGWSSSSFSISFSTCTPPTPPPPTQHTTGPTTLPHLRFAAHQRNATHLVPVLPPCVRLGHLGLGGGHGRRLGGRQGGCCPTQHTPCHIGIHKTRSSGQAVNDVGRLNHPALPDCLTD